MDGTRFGPADRVPPCEVGVVGLRLVAASHAKLRRRQAYSSLSCMPRPPGESVDSSICQPSVRIVASRCVASVAAARSAADENMLICDSKNCADVEGRRACLRTSGSNEVSHEAKAVAGKAISQRTHLSGRGFGRTWVPSPTRLRYLQADSVLRAPDSLGWQQLLAENSTFMSCVARVTSVSGDRNLGKCAGNMGFRGG